MQSLRLSRLEFTSLLSYIPRQGGGDKGDQSRDLMHILKRGLMFGSPPAPFSDTVASLINNPVPQLAPIKSMLSAAAVLVPVPRSTLWKEGILWVPDQIASSLVRIGFGSRSSRLLARSEAIHKAATSLAAGRPRPTALDHYRTLAVQKELITASEIVLIDDVVTTGGTLLGSANRLLESYPSVPIRAFAAMRAVSNPLEFKDAVDPVLGSITLLSGGRCYRQP